MANAILWKDGSFHEDSFQTFEEGGERTGDLIISFADFKDHDWSSHKGKLGLSVTAEDDIDEVAATLSTFDLVVVNFPVFADGRAFSIARLIRDKHAYEGEIRARGAYILDQMPILERCGVTAFEISSDAIKSGLERGLWPDVPRYYQFALDGEGNHARVRHTDTKRPWLSVNVNAEKTGQDSAT